MHRVKRNSSPVAQTAWSQYSYPVLWNSQQGEGVKRKKEKREIWRECCWCEVSEAWTTRWWGFSSRLNLVIPSSVWAEWKGLTGDGAGAGWTGKEEQGCLFQACVCFSRREFQAYQEQDAVFSRHSVTVVESTNGLESWIALKTFLAGCVEFGLWFKQLWLICTRFLDLTNLLFVFLLFLSSTMCTKLIV